MRDSFLGWLVAAGVLRIGMLLVLAAFAAEPTAAPGAPGGPPPPPGAPGGPPAPAPAPTAAQVAQAAAVAEAAHWETDARRRVDVRWNNCLTNLPASVSLPEPSYTTVAELDVSPEGAPENVRIVKPSGSDALDACVFQAFREPGVFSPPPPSLLTTGKAHLADVSLTVHLRSTAPPATGGKPAEATRVPTASAADVATAPARIATLAKGSRNIWCGGSPLVCSIRDATGHMLVQSVTVCHRDADLYFETAYGPMSLHGGLDLVPGAAACK